MKLFALITTIGNISYSKWRSYGTNMQRVKQDNSYAALCTLHILRTLQMLVAIIVIAISALHLGSPWTCFGVFISLLVTYSLLYLTLAEIVFTLYKMSKQRN